MLREYQQRAINQLYEWFRQNETGNPCLVLPTGSGKSHIVAALCKDALQHWPETRVLMLTHVKELIEQNAQKMVQHWPNVPLGIYSASLGKRDLGEPITFAGIQSVRNRASDIGHVDLIIIDECHLVNHDDEGGYRTLIAELTDINPHLRVIGLTATPYRLGHGMITDGDAIFNALIEPVTIEELVTSGYLSILRSKITQQQLDVSGVHKRGGEYIEKELQRAIDHTDITSRVVDEVIHAAGSRKSWLFFCAGVQHAHHVAEELNERGFPSGCVTGETPKKQREAILSDFRAGKLMAVTNANVLTTGFDAPNIDLIAMLRPTMSPGLYVQMAGRGLRLKEHTDHCIVLDFAGVVKMHGPITAVTPPRQKGQGGGEVPTKSCPSCGEIIHAAMRSCPSCGHLFESEHAVVVRHNDDIMGIEQQEMAVSEWEWREHTSRTSGKRMLAVTYYGDLSDRPITEYLTVTHDGDPGRYARIRLATIARQSQAAIDITSALDGDDLSGIAAALTSATPPSLIKYAMNGKFPRVAVRDWVAPRVDAPKRQGWDEDIPF
jgi:DNA repair protein RadD